jgi:hypothetical protein
MNVRAPSSIVAVVAAALCLIAAAAAQPQASVRIVGKSSRTYVSARYHYSLPVPAGFTLTPAKADQLYGFFPGAPSSEVDFFGAGPVNTPKGIAVASVALPAGTTLKKWDETNLQAIARQFSCHVPQHKAITLDGTPATELIYASTCYGNFDTIEVVHGVVTSASHGGSR